MRKLLAVATMATALGINSAAHAAGSAEAGQGKSAVCAACHGTDGNSVNPAWPSLAGQHASYMVAQLQAFKDGERQNDLMTPMAAGLSEQDMQDLAAYYEAQEPATLAADPELVERGRQIYLGGDLDRQVTACAACHGPTGRGNPLALFPRIAGQHATYAEIALQDFAAGDRANPMMQDIATRMSPDDMRAVSTYMQGLR